MSLEKAIAHGKEWRKPYREPKAVDRSCRNHGSCPACQAGRQHKHRRRAPAPDVSIHLVCPDIHAFSAASLEGAIAAVRNGMESGECTPTGDTFEQRRAGE